MGCVECIKSILKTVITQNLVPSWPSLLACDVLSKLILETTVTNLIVYIFTEIAFLCLDRTFKADESLSALNIHSNIYLQLWGLITMRGSMTTDRVFCVTIFVFNKTSLW